VNLVLVDGHALAYRSYFAFAGAPLRNSRGEETGAVRIHQHLLSLINKQAPDYIAVAFDSESRPSRHERFGAYKAHRLNPEPDPPAAGDLRRAGRDEGRAAGGPGFEADDIIATLAHALEGRVPVQVVSGDRTSSSSSTNACT
jgi:DNA polymerase-1